MSRWCHAQTLKFVQLREWGSDGGIWHRKYSQQYGKKIEPLGTQLLHESHELAKNALSGLKTTITNFEQELYHNPGATLATLAAGAAALYLTKGEGATKIAQALSKGKALGATTLEVPSLEVSLGKAGHGNHDLLATLKEKAAVTERLKGGAGEHLDFGEKLVVPENPFSPSAIADNKGTSPAHIDFNKEGIKFTSTEQETHKALERYAGSS